MQAMKRFVHQTMLSLKGCRKAARCSASRAGIHTTWGLRKQEAATRGPRAAGIPRRRRVPTATRTLGVARCLVIVVVMHILCAEVTVSTQHVPPRCGKPTSVCSLPERKPEVACSGHLLQRSKGQNLSRIRNNTLGGTPWAPADSARAAATLGQHEAPCPARQCAWTWGAGQ
jgi:hypothetical protein